MHSQLLEQEPLFQSAHDSLSEGEQLQSTAPSHTTWCVRIAALISPAGFSRLQSSMAWTVHLLKALFISTGSPCQITAYSFEEDFGNASPLSLKHFLEGLFNMPPSYSKFSQFLTRLCIDTFSQISLVQENFMQQWKPSFVLSNRVATGCMCPLAFEMWLVTEELNV